MDYGKMDTWSIRKNKPKTNPNKAKSNPIKANKMPKQTQTNPISKAKKCCWPLLTGFGGRFLLTKQAFFYRMDVLETNTYNGLLFKLCWKLEIPWIKPVIRLLYPRLSD
ncbi:MAG: hypothetical protein ACYSWZ_04120 [Planctomycetota bacterium]|jgi:hypothetical protein